MNEIRFTKDPAKIRLLRDIAAHLLTVKDMDYMKGPIFAEQKNTRMYGMRSCSRWHYRFIRGF